MMATKVAVMTDFCDGPHQLLPAALIATLELTKHPRHRASWSSDHPSLSYVLFRLVQRIVRMAQEGSNLLLRCADALEPVEKFVIVMRVSLGRVRHCGLHWSTFLHLSWSPVAPFFGRGKAS